MLGTLLFSSRDQRYNGSQRKSSYPAGAQLDIYSNRPGGKERAKEATAFFSIPPPSTEAARECHFSANTSHEYWLTNTKCEIAPHGLQCPIIMLHTDLTEFIRIIYIDMVANRVDSRHFNAYMSQVVACRHTLGPRVRPASCVALTHLHS
jgi:hypothetical protein